MKTIIITIFFLLLSGCDIGYGREIDMNDVSVSDGCCCGELETEKHSFTRWICSNPPYIRGGCLKMKANRCYGKHRHHHRRHHSTRNPDDDDGDFIKQVYQRK